MQYRISTVEQIAALTPDQQEDFLTDLAAWLEFCNGAKQIAALGIPFRANTEYIDWNDDGRPGVIDEINIKVI